MDEIKIGILTVGLNSANMGNNALCYSAISLLEEVAILLDCNMNYTLFSHEDSKALELYPEIPKGKIRIIPSCLSVRQKVKMVLSKQLHRISDFEKAFDSLDIVFEIAGDSLSDIYGLRRLQDMHAFHSFTHKRQKPMVFLPQTIGPFISPKAENIGSNSLKCAHHVFARDSISYKRALSYVSEDALTQTIDMAFFMEYEPRKKATQRPLVGINPSGLLVSGGYTGDNQFGLKSNYLQLVSAIIEELKQKEVDIVLIGHVLRGPEYSVEDDYKVCKQLLLKYPFCSIAPFFYNPIEAKSFISGMNLLIASRMHCCIAGYSSGVPIYPLAYSQKFRGLFKEQLEYPYGAELDTDDIESVVSDLNKVLQILPEIQEQMPERLEKAANYKSTLITTIKNVMSRLLS